MRYTELVKREIKKYRVFGNSYESGVYEPCGYVEAVSERAAKIKARRMFDVEGFGFADFEVFEI